MNIIKNSILCLMSVVITVFLLEALLRLLPVTELSFALEVNDINPVLRFTPNQDVVYSKGYDFSISTKKHINNFGFYSDIDYITSDIKQPILAVIGDSFVEAKQVENKKTFHGILANRLESKEKIYSFGVSGAPLSQYLAFADYAREQFKPQGMIFIIVANDFDESLLTYKKSQGFHFFNENNELVRIDRKKTPVAKNIIKRSALVRYIYLTVGFRFQNAIGAIKSFLGVDSSKNNYKANTSNDMSERRIQDSQLAVDLFFKFLPEKTNLMPNKISFVVDALRTDIYDGLHQESSYFSLMREYFINRAALLGYEVIDMTQIFLDDWLRNKRHFEFKIDAHWNEYAHAIVEQQLYQSSVYTSTFKSK